MRLVAVGDGCRCRGGALGWVWARSSRRRLPCASGSLQQLLQCPADQGLRRSSGPTHQACLRPSMVEAISRGHRVPERPQPEVGCTMWEFARHEHSWAGMLRPGDAVPELLQIVALSADVAAWDKALSCLESAGSELGVPCAATPAQVACLVAVVPRSSGEKRSAIVSLVEELTCGRGFDSYSPEERTWMLQSRLELVYGL